jgi:hypothetical protein
LKAAEFLILVIAPQKARSNDDCKEYTHTTGFDRKSINLALADCDTQWEMDIGFVVKTARTNLFQSCD